MARSQNPARREELLRQLVALTGRLPLSGLTFRTIAAELGISTYTLVYHFGTRRELIDAVLCEAMRLRMDLVGGVEFVHFTREQMTSALRTACRATLLDPELASIRLQFEGLALERLDPDVGEHVSGSYLAWTTAFGEWVQAQGVPAERASLLARLLIDTVSGIQFGHLICKDAAEGIELCDVFIDTFMTMVETAAAPAA